ncbi:MAG: hypothetical protein AB7G23_06170 [Vicinamibacterales bacterium]|nr:hypothetical protein [Acidobacteriota bacterium]
MLADIERRQALVELLAQPDAPDMKRGHRLRLAGRPDRHQLLPMLAAAYVQSRLLELRACEEDAVAEIAH